MPTERKSRYCEWCRRQMSKADRIEIGWSVMTGRMAVCSERCRLAYNTKGESERDRHWMPRGKTVWLVFDLANGDQKSRRYVWWFDSQSKP